MRIIGALWESSGNQYIIKCWCTKSFTHKSDKWKVRCPYCKRIMDLHFLREQYRTEQERFNTDKQLASTADEVAKKLIEGETLC